MKKKESISTAWQDSSQWYKEAVGEKGHYYHQKVIIPKLLSLCHFQQNPQSKLLDLACGQGVLSRHLPAHVSYLGIDAAPSLIQAAKRYRPQPNHRYLVGDVTQKLPTDETFSHATIILAIQNIENPSAVFKNVHPCLNPQGRLIIVMNHPCFRVPRQSSWGVDEQNKTRYRRIDRYMSEMKIPIMTHPGKGKASTQTWSFHHPLSSYCRWLNEGGFTVELIEEWCSDKISQGAAAKMENRSREEIPLFMTIVAKKQI
jgi:ubiquinone/menaquinone biosynthesis C-methylase UbiE